jgi:hypothetical protein
MSDELTAARKALAEALASDPDSVVRAWAKRALGDTRRYADAVGLLTELARREATRKENSAETLHPKP